MKLFIPEIGTKLVLLSDWTFMLHDESRNDSLMEFTKDPRFNAKRSFHWEAAPIPVTIPKNSSLRVDRIYIRKGASDYSSITFFWLDQFIPARVDHIPEEKYFQIDYNDDASWLFSRSSNKQKRIERIVPAHDKKIPRKPIRFWAKLDDVNQMEISRLL